MSNKTTCELCTTINDDGGIVCPSCIQEVRELEFWQTKQEHHYIDSLHTPYTITNPKPPKCVTTMQGSKMSNSLFLFFYSKIVNNKGEDVFPQTKIQYETVFGGSEQKYK